MTGRKSFFQDLQSAYRAYMGWLELKTLIPFVEGLMRIWYHLDPRVYSRSARIKRITEGRSAKNSDRFLLFVLFSQYPLPRFTQNLISAVARTQLNLVIVSNTSLDGIFRSSLLENCHLLIERANLGRDFGGYKDGISVIRERYSQIDRLLLLNDSVFFFEKGLDRLLADLDGEADFIGLTEVFEFHYHVQSFMLSFGPGVLNNPRFLEYWRKYRPISTRRWSIHKGEVDLTQRLTKAGFRPIVLYHGAQLLPYLRDKPANDLVVSVRLLPTYFRRVLHSYFVELLQDQESGPILVLESIVKALQNLAASSSADAPFSDLRTANVNSLARLTEQADAARKWTLDTFVSEIISTVTLRNQAHVGGFLFMKYLGMPVIKRDIFYREVYRLEDVYEILTGFGEPLRDEVMADLRRAGTAANLKGLSGILYRHGSI